ncbi:hypothetical protein [Halioxenophilus sp. WMMB6]|uniref:3'-5' exonuclease n=1 Tax=Halioxenophilus sp. WMMB6 TaxID=3073815 RepID=UPI00295E5963|nr:hypothetical protein [Halioxenophilus sp. WMMB6]
MFAPVIIDIEASGFGPDSYPIEVGAVLANGRRFSRLIKPFPEWQYWSNEAAAMHGISRSLLEQRGHNGHEVAHELNLLLAGQQTYSDCWVVDKPWLDKLFFQAGLPMQFILSPIEALLPDEQIACWDRVKLDVINQLNVKRHRASTDALIIQQTFMASRKLIA